MEIEREKERNGSKKGNWKKKEMKWERWKGKEIKRKKEVKDR